jgi:hypothetical protein
MQTPTLIELKQFLGIEPSDVQDDAALQQALDAALAAQQVLVCYPIDGFNDPYFTPDLRTAIFLRAQRYVARRNSPEGVVGLAGTGGDFVGARVAVFDADVLNLEGPYRRIPVA